ncbi:hypothetical protein [Candidatus Cyanaurora vandensis]|uniref:hypothetical protein n=1 Tax=Candidatus Cyanaurora vandensis TaxID=2714958 RepID=UPI00257FFDDE|nr:hypothetical protein [Candidatus Cyanaurora vandensis]
MNPNAAGPHAPELEYCSSRYNHHQLIRAHWDLLAAVAWQSYLQDGRGVLMVEVVPADLRVTYVVGPPKSVLRRAVKTSLLGMLHDYDPTAEVVCLVVQHGHFTPYRIAQNLSPETAYHRYQGRLCEFQLN